MALRPLRAGDPLTVGPYKLAARLGSGGMGVVYLGVDTSGGQVAVKVLRDEYLEDSGFRRRFTREATAIAAIDSPRVARLLDADPSGDTPWIATEYVHGPTLMGAVTAGGPTAAADLRDLATGLAEALEAIHSADVVHRDLKPSNVMMAEDGPKVIDFGIVAGLPGTMTASGVVLGSVGYMAPELIADDMRPGPAADVFGWGLTIAYAATGRPPFGDGPLQALVLRTVQGDADIDGVPGDLRPMISAALRKKPEQRPGASQILRWLATGTMPAGVPRDETGEAAAGEVQAGEVQAGEVQAGEVRAPRPAWDGLVPLVAVPAGTAREAPPRSRRGRGGSRPGERRRDGGSPGSTVGASGEPAGGGPGAPRRPRRRPVAAGARRLVPSAGVVVLVAAAAGMAVVPGDMIGTEALGQSRGAMPPAVEPGLVDRGGQESARSGRVVPAVPAPPVDDPAARQPVDPAALLAAGTEITGSVRSSRAAGSGTTRRPAAQASRGAVREGLDLSSLSWVLRDPLRLLPQIRFPRVTVGDIAIEFGDLSAGEPTVGDLDLDDLSVGDLGLGDLDVGDLDVGEAGVAGVDLGGASMGAAGVRGAVSTPPIEEISVAAITVTGGTGGAWGATAAPIVADPDTAVIPRRRLTGFDSWSWMRPVSHPHGYQREYRLD